MNQKQLLRNQLRNNRKSVDDKQRVVAEALICSYLKRFIRRDMKIAVYRAIGSEVRLNNFIRMALRRGAKIFEPVIDVNSRRLWFVAWGSTLYGHHTIKQRIENMDIVVLPLLGVDESGMRLGQGGGYYDTSLSFCKKRKPLRIGVGFACQMVEFLPSDAHDERLNAFVCEMGVKFFK
ncbi:MAG: 5-formyltetrahydrofolate cyclo-ligase [Neisseriaceae bacterium]|nr:5-formyltetrahydrofolate cyclo-ligase [Neisseriaceae bacterium]